MGPTASCSVLAGAPKGLIWHFQGRANRCSWFRRAEAAHAPEPAQPTVIIAVDRIDLDAQISATFHAADIPQPGQGGDARNLAQLLRQDSRKIIITTIFKFGEAEGCSTPASNIVVLVDEAHRTQEGELASARCARRCPTPSSSG